MREHNGCVTVGAGLVNISGLVVQVNVMCLWGLRAKVRVMLASSRGRDLALARYAADLSPNPSPARRGEACLMETCESKQGNRWHPPAGEPVD